MLRQRAETLKRYGRPGNIAMDRNDPKKSPGTITSLHKTLWAEIHKERERHRSCTHRYHRQDHADHSGRCDPDQYLPVLENPLYPLMFTSASFFLFMFYFVTLLIPHNLKETPLPQTEIFRYLVRLRENGIIVSTRRFTRVFLNAFFINCRPLFYGFALIFSLDIVLVIAMAAQDVLSSSSTVIILMNRLPSSCSTSLSGDLNHTPSNFSPGSPG